MNLLSLAQDKAVPAADDFVPVLVFVSFHSTNLDLHWSHSGDYQGEPSLSALHGAVC